MHSHSWSGASCLHANQDRRCSDVHLSLPAVAGLKGHVPPEQLQGSMGVAILNLKPAKLAGMASEAMLLAANAPQDGGAELVSLLIPPGMYSLLCLGALVHLVAACALHKHPFQLISTAGCRLSDQAAPDTRCLLNSKLSVDCSRCSKYCSKATLQAVEWMCWDAALCGLLNQVLELPGVRGFTSCIFKSCRAILVPMRFLSFTNACRWLRRWGQGVP